MKRVRCKSGLMGWQDRLRNVYASLTEFRAWNALYGLARRLGYRSAVAAWRDNPLVRGSVDPSDYCRVYQPAPPPGHPYRGKPRRNGQWLCQ